AGTAECRPRAAVCEEPGVRRQCHQRLFRAVRLGDERRRCEPQRQHAQDERLIRGHAMPSLSGPIKHIVVLMMENRSFDHMLGYFKPAQGTLDVLQGSETNPDLSDRRIAVSPLAGYRNDLDTDPAHGFLDVNEQIFGVRDDDVSAYHPTMQGFVRNYARICQRPENIMHCFDPLRLPMLTTLAREFAVCDRWFSSVPGAALPNSAFAQAATSQGRVDMSPIYPNLHTIYEFLQGRGVSAKIYYYSRHSWSMALSFAGLMGNQFNYFGLLDDFLTD